ncbi:lipase family protein [Mycobacterium sp. NPDC006124]|uniref:lipase family protein n=1 Tax=Mycobacterium sp. NPDC006124 TaxID=3156729 RepID=UPI0033A34C63
MKLSGDFSSDGPGSLISAVTLPAVDRRVRSTASLAARITYLSTAANGRDRTTVSGTVVVPQGKPPEGGWRIIAYGHSTSGIQTECAPSLDPALSGAATEVMAMVRARYIVVVPDFEGLGVGGFTHPYLDPTVEGFNLIDSVRATKKLVPNTSQVWAALGVSQGGQAAWAANELARTYGDAGKLVGVASLSPPADFEGLADAAAAGTLTDEQRPAYQWLIVSLARRYADINVDDYRSGYVRDNWDVLSQCSASGAERRATTLQSVTADDLRPASPAAVDVLRDHLRAMSLPQSVTVAPMLVTYGGADQLVLPAWTQAALERGCEMGDVIDVRLRPGKSHGDVDVGAAFGWLTDRFNDRPVQNTCSPSTEPAQDGQ